MFMPFHRIYMSLLNYESYLSIDADKQFNEIVGNAIIGLNIFFGKPVKLIGKQ